MRPATTDEKIPECQQPGRVHVYRKTSRFGRMLWVCRFCGDVKRRRS